MINIILTTTSGEDFFINVQVLPRVDETVYFSGQVYIVKKVVHSLFETSHGVPRDSVVRLIVALQ